MNHSTERVFYVRNAELKSIFRFLKQYESAGNIGPCPPIPSFEKTYAIPAGAIKLCENPIDLQPLTEKVIWCGCPTYLFYLPFIILGIILIPLLGLGLVFIIYAIMDRQETTYRVTDKRIEFSRGILSRTTCEIALRDIKSVNIQQLNLLERIYNQGTVEIVSIASVIKFSCVKNPDWLGSAIRQQMQKHSR